MMERLGRRAAWGMAPSSASGTGRVLWTGDATECDPATTPGQAPKLRAGILDRSTERRPRQGTTRGARNDASLRRAIEERDDHGQHAPPDRRVLHHDFHRHAQLPP